MKRALVLLLLIFIFATSTQAQFNLIVNEFSQGNGGTKEFIELLVVGTRTCTDSTADIRNWIFDDQNGWYGGAGNGIAVGHYRFSNDPNWEKVPFGSIILIYNNADQNGNIPAGASDPTDANHDYTYILPANSSLIEQNGTGPASPSSPTFTYPAAGYAASSGWSSLGLANSGDAVIVVDPANLSTAHFSILFGLPGGTGFQTPTVSVGEVAANKNCYLSNDQYTNGAAWMVGSAGTTDETPGAGNNAANNTWIQSMRVQAASVVPASVTVQPTCTVPTGTITVSNPVGVVYTYSIDGINFQPGNAFTLLTPGPYTVTVLTSGLCPVTIPVTIDPVPTAPPVPGTGIIQPTCATPTGTITINSPTGAGYTYSIDGINFQPGNVFNGLSPDTYTITVSLTGCTSTGSVTINPPPGAPVIPDATILQPTCATPTGTITINSPTGAGYTYSIDGINFQPGTVFNGLNPGPYTITVSLTGCSSTGSVTINPPPGTPVVPDATILQPTCATPTGTITINSPTGAGYTYSIDGINFQPGTVFNGLNPGPYTIAVSLTGCTSTGSATIDPVPGGPAVPNTAIIQPTCTAPTGTITINTPTGPGYTYSVDGINFQTGTVFNGLTPDNYTVTVALDGCISAGNVNINVVPGAPAAPNTNIVQPTCTTPTGTVAVNSPLGTTYTYSIDGVHFQAGTVFPGLTPNNYTITVQESGGCSSSAGIVINNVPNPPLAPAVSSPVNYCQHATAAALTATGVNLLWYTNPSGGVGMANAPVPSTTVVGTTTFYVSQTVAGCESVREPIDVIIGNNITVDPITGNTILCVKGNSSTILSSITPGGTWNSSNTSVAVVDNAGHVSAIAAGVTTVTYAVSASGCTASVSATVNVNNFELSLSATPNPVSTGNAISLVTSSASGYEVMEWLPAATFLDQTAINQSIVMNDNAVYYAIGQSLQGCIDTAQVSVTVMQPVTDIFVPNVFTPNNDGKNDELRVYGNAIRAIDFKVFNQWGEAVFETTDKNKGWNGIYKGKVQPVTVYVYVVKASMENGSVITKKGSVTLIR